MKLKQKIAGVAVAGALGLGLAAGPAAAQTKQDGLVNVSVGDVTIAEDINVAAAVDVVAQICGLDVDAVVAVLSAAEVVDQTSRNYTVCRVEDGKVKITQN